MFITVLVGLAVLVALALFSAAIRQRRSRGLSKDERAARRAESREVRRETEAGRAESHARDAAGSGSAQSQTRQF